MTELKGIRDMTIAAEAGEIYDIFYNDYAYADIYNGTDGDIYVNVTGEFESADGVGEYLTIPAGGGYNKYPPVPDTRGGRLYIYAAAAGNIAIKTVL